MRGGLTGHGAADTKLPSLRVSDRSVKTRELLVKTGRTGPCQSFTSHDSPAHQVVGGRYHPQATHCQRDMFLRFKIQQRVFNGGGSRGSFLGWPLRGTNDLKEEAGCLSNRLTNAGLTSSSHEAKKASMSTCIHVLDRSLLDSSTAALRSMLLWSRATSEAGTRDAFSLSAATLASIWDCLRCSLMKWAESLLNSWIVCVKC